MTVGGKRCKVKERGEDWLTAGKRPTITGKVMYCRGGWGLSVSLQIAHGYYTHWNMHTDEQRKTDLIRINSNQPQQAPAKTKYNEGWREKARDCEMTDTARWHLPTGDLSFSASGRPHMMFYIASGTMSASIYICCFLVIRSGGCEWFFWVVDKKIKTGCWFDIRLNIIVAVY